MHGQCPTTEKSEATAGPGGKALGSERWRGLGKKTVSAVQHRASALFAPPGARTPPASGGGRAGNTAWTDHLRPQRGGNPAVLNTMDEPGAAVLRETSQALKDTRRVISFTCGVGNEQSRVPGAEGRAAVTGGRRGCQACRRV